MRSSTGSRVVIATRVFLFVQAFLDIKAARYRGEEDYSDRYLIWSKSKQEYCCDKYQYACSHDSAGRVVRDPKSINITSLLG